MLRCIAVAILLPLLALGSCVAPAFYTETIVEGLPAAAAVVSADTAGEVSPMLGDGLHAVNLGFNFPFFGNFYRRLQISSLGTASLMHYSTVEGVIIPLNFGGVHNTSRTRYWHDLVSERFTIAWEYSLSAPDVQGTVQLGLTLAASGTVSLAVLGGEDYVWFARENTVLRLDDEYLFTASDASKRILLEGNCTLVLTPLDQCSFHDTCYECLARRECLWCGARGACVSGSQPPTCHAKEARGCKLVSECPLRKSDFTWMLPLATTLFLAAFLATIVPRLPCGLSQARAQVAPVPAPGSLGGRRGNNTVAPAIEAAPAAAPAPDQPAAALEPAGPEPVPAAAPALAAGVTADRGGDIELGPITLEDGPLTQS